jgi:hypothetical protein
MGEKMADLYNVSFEDIHQAVIETRKSTSLKTTQKETLDNRELINQALKEANNLMEDNSHDQQ